MAADFESFSISNYNQIFHSSIPSGLAVEECFQDVWYDHLSICFSSSILILYAVDSSDNDSFYLYGPSRASAIAFATLPTR
jgi:hypothetical protein